MHEDERRSGTARVGGDLGAVLGADMPHRHRVSLASALA